MAKRGRKDKEEGVVDPAKDEHADSSIKKDKRRKTNAREPRAYAEPKTTSTPSKKPSRKGAQAAASANKSTACVKAKASKNVTKAFRWTSDQEIVVLVELAKVASADDGHNNSFNWEQLAQAAGWRLGLTFTRSQIYEKARHLKEKYLVNNKKISAGEFGSFKTPDDEKRYKLSQRIWGTGEGLTLHLEEDEQDPLAANLEKLSDDAVEDHKLDAVHDPVADTSELNTQREEDETQNQISSPKRHALKEDSRDQREPTEDPGLGADVVKGYTQRTFDLFHAECEAFLKDLQNSCKVVLESMQVKFLSMVKGSGGSHSVWARGGSSTRVPPLESVQTSGSWDAVVDNFLAADGPPGAGELAAFQRLREQWQQHRLQELKLTSLKLQLMLEECKLEQEKLEKQAFKSP